MEIGSINRAISFLGMTRTSPRDSVSPIASRRSAERHDSRQPTQATETIEPAFATRFSQEALKRADDLKDRGEDEAQPLSKDEQEEISKLKRRDQEVRRHEQAHKAAAGNLASGSPSFGTTRGPDGRQYAVSGEVQIDASPVSGDPEATIRKMRQVQRAARAPAQPSGTDFKVASSASKQEASARAELRQEKTPGQADSIVSRSPAPPLPEAYRASNENQSGRLLNLLA